MTRPLLHSTFSRSVRVLALAPPVLFCVLIASTALAGKTYERSKHGDPVTGVFRIPSEGRGSCSQCHDNHASRYDVPNGGPFQRLLFTTDDETLCYSCHVEAGVSRSYPGIVGWADSTHSISPDAWWPGPVPRARRATDAGKCINCHDPHAAEDKDGDIPSMLRIREQDMCLGCHDGAVGADVKTQVSRPYSHPIDLTGRHAAVEGNDSDPARYDDSSGADRRHAECADCHNAHLAKTDTFPPVPPLASARLAGVARIRVTNGGAGTKPLYEWRPADDMLAAREYEICFKCHSSWTQLPPGKPDLAILTNPANASYHPVQAAGKNANISASAFETGWSSTSVLHCSTCHRSDDPVAGPHGSAYRYLLPRAYTASAALRTMAESELCFSCHAFAVYANPSSSDGTQQASRFNRPGAAQGHAYHVGAQQVSCYTCHVTHGSAANPSLIATGRSPGIVLYSQNAGGGTCTPTCHQTRTWSVNYAR